MIVSLFAGGGHIVDAGAAGAEKPPGCGLRSGEMRERPPLLSAVVVVIACAALAGCATTSSTTSDDPPPARPATARLATARPATGRLPVSTASSHTVQPQPAPGSCHARGSGLFSLPDPRCTPGAISAAVTQLNIDSTICRHGYTKTVRPSESVTEREKFASMDAYGDNGSPHDYEYDHLVSLELGGALNDWRNLWPEPGASPNLKDKVEDRLHELVCDRQISLASAQRQIAGSWIAAYKRLLG
jgi:hypothetical protein